MRFVRSLTMIGAIMGVCFVVSGAPVSATPLGSGVPEAAAGTSAPQESYMRHRGYRRYYAPRRVYYRPRRVYRPYRVYRPARYYRPRYYRPRVVCRVRYTHWGARRVCYRRY